jgi:hypothetical protein
MTHNNVFEVVALLLCVLVIAANAVCNVPPSSVCSAITQQCTATYFKAQLNDTSISPTFRNALLTAFRNCNPGNGTDCCSDPCAKHTRPSDCFAEPGCYPLSTAQDVVTCLTRSKLCSLATEGAWCNSMDYCTWSSANSLCTWQLPVGKTPAPASPLAPDENVDEKCPGLHPLVIAMLALMFISFVAGVAVVVVVVRRKQMQADAEAAEQDRKEQLRRERAKKFAAQKNGGL